MKRALIGGVIAASLIGLLLAVAVDASAPRAYAQDGDSRFATFQKEINPMLVPSVNTAVPGITSTVYVNEITLTNITGSDVTCSILDQQGSPMALFSNVVHPGIYIMPFKGRKMPNGITWSCTGGGAAVVGYIQYATGRY